MTNDELDKLFDVPFTFSRFCVSGLAPKHVPRCECWRCREKRGEPRDEGLAEKVSTEARKAHSEWMAEFLKRMRG